MFKLKKRTTDDMISNIIFQCARMDEELDIQKKAVQELKSVIESLTAEFRILSRAQEKLKRSIIFNQVDEDHIKNVEDEIAKMISKHLLDVKDRTQELDGYKYQAGLGLGGLAGYANNMAAASFKKED